MKIRIYHIVFILLAFFLVTQSVQAFSLFTPKKSLTSGLVGWYTFDGKDITNGRINDVSGNGNNGVVSNISTSTFYVSGKVGQGIKLDGTDDFIKPGIFTDGQSVLTVSFWIKSNASTNPGIPISKGRFAAATAGSWDFQRSGAGTWSMNLANSSAAVVTANGPSAHNNTNWQFVTGVYNGSTVTLYVNAVAGTPVAQTGAVQTALSYPICIGAINGDSSGTCSQSRFAGIIDDIRIYNRALSASEVLQLYNQGGGNKQNVVAKNSLTSGLVGWWTFDGKDVVNGRANDVSGNANHGRLISISTSTFYTTGKIGQGFRFDAIDDYVDVGDLSGVEGKTALTVSAWVKSTETENVSGSDMIISKTGSGSDTFEMYWEQNESVSFCVVGSSGTSCGGADTAIASYASGIPIGSGKNWYHIVGVYDSVSSIVKVYVNGVQGGVTGSLSSLTQNSTHTIKIGNSWSGTIDDVRIYSRALSASEVLQLYNQGGGTKQSVVAKNSVTSGIIGWWTFDGKDMVNGVAVNLATTSAFYGRPSNISTSTFYTSGKLGQALRFDATDDTMVAGDMTNADNVSVLTTSVWVKPAVADTSAITFFSKTRGGFDTWFLARNGFENFWAEMCSASTCVDAISDATFADTNWHHLVSVYNGTDLRLYVDGVLADSTPPSLTGTIKDRSDSICFGGTWNGSSCSQSYTGGGLLDDARIYSRALSASEVLQLYNQGK